MTKQEAVNDAVGNWQELGLADPRKSQVEFVKSMISAGVLPPGQAMKSACRMVRGALAAGHDEPEEEGNNSPIVLVKERHRLTDTHYVFYPRRGRPFGLKRTVVEEMKRAYANKPNGLGYTINQVCKTFRIGRREFEFVKTELGWTHDQDEFTREEHLELTTEQLLNDREQRSRWLLEQAQKQAELKELRKYAALGRDLEARNEAVRLALQDYEPPKPPQTMKGMNPKRAFVIPIADFHTNKAGDQLGADALTRLIDGLDLRGADVFMVWLGDLFHVDTPKNTTTRGTPQEVETFDPYMGLKRGYQLGLGATGLVEAQRPASVQHIVVSGNHDEMATYHWQITLEALGKDVDSQGSDPLKYARWKDELFLFEHGDGARGDTKTLLLAAHQRFRELLGKTKRTWMWTGHLHHVKQLDVGGSIHHQLPSPAQTDRWHKKNGYESLAAVQAFEYSERGLAKVHWELV